MQVISTAIPDVMLIRPKVFGDVRGFFCETFNQREFNKATGTNYQFVQDNSSRSGRGVLRGLHYQLSPCAQGKLVRATRGCVWDVVVDIRQKSSTFGCWVGQELSEENGLQLWVPPGFAHGFCVISESADFSYKTTDYYHPELERGIAWSDPKLAIAWPDIGVEWVLSDKDGKLPVLGETQLL